MFLLVAKRSGALFKSPVTRYYILTCLVVGLLISLDLWKTGTYESLGEAVRYGFFQTFCSISTTGFATADTSVWPAFSILLLVFVIFQGGCSGSTTGGIKSDRLLIAFYSIRAQITKKLHPRSVVP
ncbi:MAG TPA: cation transporter, partial [Rikenellaceae bacterium]|nr:cation transporter [Rikenellaceae bacterium]